MTGSTLRRAVAIALLAAAIAVLPRVAVATGETAPPSAPPAAAVPTPALTPALTPAKATPRWPEQFSGRLARIKASRSVRIGYREDAIPFSYVDPERRPVGYSLDLCAAIVRNLADELGVPLATEFVPVTAQDRFEKVVDGRVDLECGSTTNDVLRRKLVAFSPAIFVTGTRLAVPRGAAQARALRSVRGLAGRSIAVVAGTTAEAVLREFDHRHELGLRLLAAGGYREALALVQAGKADALAADEVLLLGLLVETGSQATIQLVGSRLSVETYGIAMPRDDPALAAAVSAALQQLAESREFVWIYNRWFLRPLPGRGALGLPMSGELRRALELIGLPTS